MPVAVRGIRRDGDACARQASGVGDTCGGPEAALEAGVGEHRAEERVAGVGIGCAPVGLGGEQHREGAVVRHEGS